MQLEPRYMFDAAGVITALAVDIANEQPVDITQDDLPSISSSSENDHRSEDLIQALDIIDYLQDIHALGQPSATVSALEGPAREIVIIDSQVDGESRLLGALLSTADAYVLDENRSAVKQISSILSLYADLDALHIISHGGEGYLSLGEEKLSLESLDTYNNDLAIWGNALSSEGDILLYACEVADDGDDDFLKAIAEATGADIAASTDITGDTIAGGDWILEAEFGDIESDAWHVYDIQALQNEEQNAATDINFEMLMLTGGENTEPAFNDGTSTTITVNEGSSATDITSSLDVTDTDVDQTLTWSEESAPSNGSLSISGTASTGSTGTNNATPGTATYTPTANVSGSDSFQVTVTDSEGATDTITINATITDVNPDIGDESFSVSTTASAGTAVGTLANSGDTDGLSFSITGGTGQSLFDINSSSGQITVASGATLNEGSVTLDVSVDDEDSDSTADDTATITINISAPDTTAPVVQSIAPSGSPSASDTSVTFTVTFDETASNISTDDFELTSTGTAAGTISAVSASSGSTVDVTVNSITGTGTLRLDLKASTDIADSSSNSPPSAFTSGTTHTVDRDAPTASLTASNVSTMGGSSYSFTIAFTDTNGSIDVSTLDNSDITVTGPNSYSSSATFVSVDTNSNGTPRTATYSITPPGGTWDAADDGTYTVTMNASQVSDTSSNSVTDGSLGTFWVSSNSQPSFTNLDGDSVAWAGVGGTVNLDSGGDATISDSDLDALNSSSGDYSGATLTVQRSGTALSSDVFGFSTSGSPNFSVDTTNSQLKATNNGDAVFASYTNTGGVLTITFSGSGVATNALVQEVIQRVTYRSDTPFGNASIEYKIDDGSSSVTATSTATVTVTSSTIYVTQSADDSDNDLDDGASLREAATIASNQSGNETIVFDSSLASQTITLSGSSLSLESDLSFDSDAASGITITGETLTLAGGITWSNGAGDSATVGSSIAQDTSATGSITKTGAGTLILSGTNTYSGGATISAGTLQGNSNSLPGDIENNGTLIFDQNSSGTFSGSISGTGALTSIGSSTLTISGSNSYTGLTTISAGKLIATNDNALGSTDAGTTIASGATLQADNMSTAETFTVSGPGKSNGGALRVFNGATTLSGNITLDGDASFYAGSNTSLSLTSVISGAFGINKTGNGTISFAGDNTYTGETTVSSGTLEISHSSALGTTDGATTVASGATLKLGTGLTISENLTISGTGYSSAGVLNMTGSGTSTVSGTVSLAADSTINTGSGSTLNVTGQVSGNFALTKNGAGTLTLENTSNSSATGDISVESGTLEVASDSALTGGTLTLNGGTLSVTGSTTVDNAVVIGSSNGTVETTADVTASGVFSGSGSLTKVGTGTLTLSGSNSYEGGTTISAGKLVAAHNDSLGTGSATLEAATLGLSGSTTSIGNAITLSGNGTFDAATDTTLSGVISDGSGSFSLTKTGASTLTLSGTNSYDGGTTISAGTLQVTAESLPGDVVNNSTLIFAQESNGTYSGSISGTGALISSGSNTLTISGSNSYTGLTTISAGKLIATNDNALGSTDAGTTIASGATLQADNISTAETFTVSGPGKSNGGALRVFNGATTLSGDITLGADASFYAGSNTSLSLTSVISGAFGINKTGNGTISFAGDNTYTGETTVSSGTLEISHSSALGTTDGATTVASGATLKLGTGLTISENLTISGTGYSSAGALNMTGSGSSTVSGTVSLAADSTINTGSGSTLNVTGQVSGNFALTKNGAGTLTLENTNNSSATGDISVESGTLEVVSDSALTGGTLTLNGGALSVTGNTTVDNAVVIGSSNGTVETTADVTASGVFSGSGSLTKVGTGTLTLSGSNSYEGGTTISAGKLVAAHNDSLGTGSATLGAATLGLSGSTTSIGNAITLSGNGTFDAATDTTLSGVISDGSGSFSLTKTGASTLTLSGTNSYDGGTTISAGTLQVTVDSLPGDVVNNSTLIFAQESNGTYSGSISGTGALISSGSNTLTISGSNSYEGLTTISAGKLIATNDNALGSTDAGTTIASGATLQADNISTAETFTVSGPGKSNG
ncbi:autotransporter-associated beta strand repeat-containing protein, partial [Magnetococcales bacterium HHB-1]